MKKKFVPGTSRAARSVRTLALRVAMEAEQQAAVGRRLKELRGARTQQPVADYVDVTLRAYQAWEAGDSGISWPHLKQLAKYFNVSENYLLYGSEEGPGHEQAQFDRIESAVSRLEEQVQLLRAELAVRDAEALQQASQAPAPTRRSQRQRRA